MQISPKCATPASYPYSTTHQHKARGWGGRDRASSHHSLHICFLCKLQWKREGEWLTKCPDVCKFGTSRVVGSLSTAFKTITLWTQTWSYWVVKRRSYYIGLLLSGQSGNKLLQFFKKICAKFPSKLIPLICV